MAKKAAVDEVRGSLERHQGWLRRGWSVEGDSCHSSARAHTSVGAQPPTRKGEIKPSPSSWREKVQEWRGKRHRGLGGHVAAPNPHQGLVKDTKAAFPASGPAPLELLLASSGCFFLTARGTLGMVGWWEGCGVRDLRC